MEGKPSKKADSGFPFCTECGVKKQADELACGACGYVFPNILTPEPANEESITAGKGRAAGVSQTATMNEKPSITDSETSFRAEEQTHAPQMSSKSQKKNLLKTSVPIVTESKLNRTSYWFMVIVLIALLYYIYWG